MVIGGSFYPLAPGVPGRVLVGPFWGGLAGVFRAQPVGVVLGYVDVVLLRSSRPTPPVTHRMR